MNIVKKRNLHLRLCAIFLLISVMSFPNTSFADMCCYIVPAKITLKNSKSQKGFLILYGDQIIGFENKKSGAKKTIAFGMNSPSTPEHKWVGIDYKFDTIKVSNRSVTINVRKEIHFVHNVNHFFSDKGLPFTPKYWTNKEGYLRYESKPIPMSEIALIERTGAINSSLSPYYD